MTTHYMATIDGVTVTRSTAGRAYTHVLVGFVNIAQERSAGALLAELNYPRAIARLTKEANGQTLYLDWCSDPKMLEMFTRDLTPEAKAAKVAERKAEYMARHNEQVAKSTQELAAYDAHTAERTNKTTDGAFYVCDLGWSSRLDLAEKNLATHRKPGYRYDRLEILDAVVTTKRAKPSKSKATR